MCLFLSSTLEALSKMVDCRKLRDPLLSLMFNPIPIGVQNSLLFQWNDVVLNSLIQEAMI